MSTKSGAMENAFADACGDEGAPTVVGVSVEQLDLLRDEHGKLPADTLLRIRRGRGRPSGARNRRTSDLAKLICQQYGNPVQFMASIYHTPLDQLVETMMLAEGIPERERELSELIAQAQAMMAKALDEQWGVERLKLLDKFMDRLERAVSALKNKPGDLAHKARTHQLIAAREVATYTDSRKPVEATVTHKVDGVILMGGAPPGDPSDDALRLTHEAINSGTIDPDRIQDLRFSEADNAWIVRDDAEGDDDGDA